MGWPLILCGFMLLQPRPGVQVSERRTSTVVSESHPGEDLISDCRAIKQLEMGFETSQPLF